MVGVCFNKLAYTLLIACQVSTHSKTDKKKLLSDRLAIYCDAPVYKALTYVTEELLMDRRRKKQLSGQFIFDDSVKRLWAIRR
jgi:hypothetical protein